LFLGQQDQFFDLGVLVGYLKGDLNGPIGTDLGLFNVQLPLEFLVDPVCRDGDAYVGLDGFLQSVVYTSLFADFDTLLFSGYIVAHQTMGADQSQGVLDLLGHIGEIELQGPRMSGDPGLGLLDKTIDRGRVGTAAHSMGHTVPARCLVDHLNGNLPAFVLLFAHEHGPKLQKTTPGTPKTPKTKRSII